MRSMVFASEQEAFVPPPDPLHVHVHDDAPLTLLTLLPAEQE